MRSSFDGAKEPEWKRDEDELDEMWLKLARIHFLSMWEQRDPELVADIKHLKVHGWSMQVGDHEL